MLSTLHFTHHGNETMMKQAQGKVFWPRIRDDLREQDWVAFMSQPYLVEVKVQVELRLILKLRSRYG